MLSSVPLGVLPEPWAGEAFEGARAEVTQGRKMAAVRRGHRLLWERARVAFPAWEYPGLTTNLMFFMCKTLS